MKDAKLGVAWRSVSPHATMDGAKRPIHSAHYAPAQPPHVVRRRTEVVAKEAT